MPTARTLLSLLTLLTLSLSLRGQYTANNPANAQWTWWNGTVLDEMGTGTVDSVFVDMTVHEHMIEVDYSFRFRVIPFDDREGEDNDSLEIRGTFELDSALTFNHIRMWMNDSMREGRVISRNNAINIYTNLVHDPTILTPQDPGLLIRQGNTYTWAMFPVGVEEHARIELQGALMSKGSLGDTMSTTLPLDMLSPSDSAIRFIQVTMHLDDEIASFQSSWQGWNLIDSNQYQITNLSYQEGSSLDLAFFPANNSEAGAIYHDDYHLRDVTLDSSKAIQPTDYLILFDIDSDGSHGSGSSSFKEVALEALQNIMDHIEGQNRFKLIVSGTVFHSFDDDWTHCDANSMDEARAFIDQCGVLQADPVGGLAYCKDIMQSQPGQIIVITSEYFQYGEGSSEQLTEMAEDLDMQHRVDIYHTGWAYAPDIYMDQTFFQVLTDLQKGEYSLTYLLENDASRIDPRLDSVVAQGHSGAELYLLNLGEGYPRKLLASGADISEAHTLTFYYSDRQLFAQELPAVPKRVVSDDLQSIYGLAKYDRFAKNAIYLNATQQRMESISINNRVLTNHSGLLVVEHDSQYADTSQNVPDDPMPVSTESKEQKIADIEVFPNPTESELTIQTSSIGFVLVRVFDLNGRLILEERVAETTVVHLDLGGSQAGTYILEMHLADGTKQTKRFIIQ